MVHSRIDGLLREKAQEIIRLQQRIEEGNLKLKQLDEEKNNTSVFAFSQKKRINNERAVVENETNSLMEELQQATYERDSLQGQIDEVTQQVQNANDALEGLEKATEQDKQKIASLTNINGVYKTRIESLEKTIEHNRERIETIQLSTKEKIKEKQRDFELQKIRYEKERLLSDIGNPAITVLKVPDYKPKKDALIDEVQLNKTLDLMITAENESTERKAWKALLKKNTAVINKIKELNKELGLDDYDSIERFNIALEPDTREEAHQCLPERFLYLNNFFGKRDSWQHLRKCMAKGSNKIEQSMRFLFNDVPYRVLLGGNTSKMTALLFPYCVVTYTSDTGFEVSLLDGVAVACQYKDKDVEDRKGKGEPPADKEVLSQQYLHPNADGSPNKRYKYNPLVFKTRESWLEIKIGKGRKNKVPMKTFSEAEGFVRCFNDHVKALHAGVEGDVYKAILEQKELEEIRGIIEAYEEVLRKRKEEQKRQQKELERIRQEQRLAEEREKEQQRLAIIERQKRINEERKAEQKAKREKQKKIRAMFDDADSMLPEKSVQEEPLELAADEQLLAVTSDKLISNNIFKVTLEKRANIEAKALTLFFTDIAGNTISNKKKADLDEVGSTATVGFVLKAGIDFTQMTSCLLEVRSADELIQQIRFGMNISYFSDF